MFGKRMYSLLLIVLLLLAGCSAVAPPPPSAGGGRVAEAATQRYFYTIMSANLRDGEPTYRLVFEGKGTFDPTDPTSVDGGGVFHELDSAPEGTPKPMVGMGAGHWRPLELLGFEQIGTFGAGIAGVVDLAIELISDDGTVRTGVLRVNCNLPAGGLWNQMEDGSNMPEGIWLTVDDLDSYSTIVPETGPSRGMTLIGVVPE